MIGWCVPCGLDCVGTSPGCPVFLLPSAGPTVSGESGNAMTAGVGASMLGHLLVFFGHSDINFCSGMKHAIGDVDYILTYRPS